MGYWAMAAAAVELALVGQVMVEAAATALARRAAAWEVARGVNRWGSTKVTVVDWTGPGANRLRVVRLP